MQNKEDLLFGKSLQHLVENALLNLNNSDVKTVPVRELMEQILKDRNDLKVFIKTTRQERNLYRRIFHVCEVLSNSNFFKMEQIKVDKISTRYFIIYTKKIS